MCAYRNNRESQLGQSLSWILRHGAVKEGLRINSEGFTSVDGILQHKSFKGKYSQSDIERVVSLDNKQRFKLNLNPNTNILEIKANQGHSIAKITDDNLTRIVLSNCKFVVVHGTFLRHWPKIKTQGLHHMQRLHIHFAKGISGDQANISQVPKNSEIYIFIDLQRAIEDDIKFFHSENGVILTRGNLNGYLIPNYFAKVVNVLTGMFFIILI